MSFHAPVRPHRRHWSPAGEKALARRPRGQRRRRGLVSWAEVRLAATIGLLIGLAWPHLETGMSATSSASDFGSFTDGGTGPAPVSARFGLCHRGGGTNCVVDGDTFYSAGDKIRVADIDTPETHPPRCAGEARLGEAATLRMQGLLNAGPFTLAGIDRDEDRYGRKLRIVMRGGESLGDALVAEGLARPYGGGRRSWC